MEQLVARQTHNLEVVGSSPAPATNKDVSIVGLHWVHRHVTIGVRAEFDSLTSLDKPLGVV